MSRRAVRRRRKRRDNFQRVGGDQLRSFLFSERELMKATDGFSSKHVIGEGGFGKVFWGKLSTEKYGTRKVAIKRAKPKAVEEQVEQMQGFVREIVLLSNIVHSNVVQLLGCCVETAVPLLVYEFVEKGTVRDYLKPQGKDPSMVLCGGNGFHSLWAWRLHVAVETAEALSYLHNLREPILHLDMKSDNILIDRNYNPKVADFGLSCFLASDATHLSNPIAAGTFGYIDPEYYQSLRITDKCDVYSFGVILLELISSWPAYSSGMVLAHHFRTAVVDNIEEEIARHGQGQRSSFIDGRLEPDADVLESIRSVVGLARRCVAVKGSERPSMQEVVGKLRQAQLKLGVRAGRAPGGKLRKLAAGLRHPSAAPSDAAAALVHTISGDVVNDQSEGVPLVATASDTHQQYSFTASSSASNTSDLISLAPTPPRNSSADAWTTATSAASTHSDPPFMISNIQLRDFNTPR